MDVRRYSATVPVSAEMLSDAVLFQETMAAYQRMSPAGRAHLAAQAKAERAAWRDREPEVSVTVERLAGALGWGPKYLHHVVQPYCTCSAGYDGWDLCPHAMDLELDTWD